MKRQSTSKLLRLMVAVFALFLLVMAGSVLSACGGTVEEQPNDNAAVHKHTYGQPEHTAIAKCGSTGYDVYTCTECGDKYAIVTAATGAHDFKNGVCEVCGLQLPKEYTAYDDSQLQELIEKNDADLMKYLKEQLEAINKKVDEISTPEEAHTHTFTRKDELTLEASCLSAGVEVGVCSCGSQSVLSWTAPKQHQYAKTGKTVPATCTTNGQEEWQCSVCLDTYWGLNTADVATGHNFQRTSTDKDKDANCITPKLLAYECMTCHEIEYQQLDDKLNEKHHSDENGESHDNDWITGEWTEYVTDGAVPSVPADGSKPDKMPTNTLDVFYATCPKCNKTAWKYETVECHHTWEVLFAKEATCEEDGRFNAYCPACERYANQVPVNGDYPDSTKWNATQEDAIVPATGHRIEVGEYGDPVHYDDYYEVDRDEHGDIITESNRNGASANTTRWKGDVCLNCGHPVAYYQAWEGYENVIHVLRTDEYVAKPGTSIYKFFHDKFKAEFVDAYLEEHTEVADEESITPEAMKEIEDDATELTRNYFYREWHIWTLYTPEVQPDGTIAEEDRDVVLDRGDTLTPPLAAAAPDYETCLKGGRYWYYCLDTECAGHQSSEEVEGGWHTIVGRWISVDHEPLKHHWVYDAENPANEAPTCTESGVAVYKCDNHFAKQGTTEEWACDAVIKVKIDATKEAAITGAEDFWKHDYRTKDAEGNITWNPEYNYPNLWNTKDMIVAEKVSGTDALFGDLEKDVYPTLDLKEIGLRIMPQAHVWVLNEEATAEANDGITCFDGHTEVYECECEIEGCCGGEESCARWEKVGEAAHVGKNGSEPKFGTYRIYENCTDGGESNEHNIIEVTYCKRCGNEISRKYLTEKNHRHFPFDRVKINALLDGHVADYTYEIESGVRTRVYIDPQDFMSDADIDARLEYANVWISIQKYWFEDRTLEGSENYEADLFNYLYTKSIPGAEGKFTVFCYDCFVSIYDYNHDCEKFDFKTNAVLKYYICNENGEYIEVTEDNHSTLNPCEYVYYAQYELECKTCGRTFRYATLNQENFGGYTRLHQNGKTVEPAGAHYLVPAYQYWTHENYEKHADGTVTMDWVCAVCGAVVERTVKYDVPETVVLDEPAADPEKQIIDINPDDKYVLLVVDLKGLDLESKLNNKDSDLTADEVLELRSGSILANGEKMESVFFFGSEENGCDKNVFKMNVRVVVSIKDTTIYVGTKDSSGKYYQTKVNESATEDYMLWNAGSLLQLSDFVDPDDEEYETLWEELYEDETKLQALIENGGNIVLGGDVTMPEAWTISKGDEVIDLNGHKLTLSKKGVEVKNTKTSRSVSVTIKGGVIDMSEATEENDDNCVMTANGVNTVLTLDDVTYLGDMSKDSKQRGLQAVNHGKLVIKNSTLVKGGFAPVIEMNNQSFSYAEYEIEGSTIASYGVGHTGIIVNGDQFKITAKGSTFYGTVAGAWIRACHEGSKFEDCTFISGNAKPVQDGDADDAWSTSVQAPDVTRAALMIGDGNGYYGDTDLELVKCKFQLSYEWFTDRNSNEINDTDITAETEGKTVEYDENKHEFTFNPYTVKDTDKKNDKSNLLLSIAAGEHNQRFEDRPGNVHLTMDEETLKQLGVDVTTMKNYFVTSIEAKDQESMRATVFFGKDYKVTENAADTTVVEQVVVEIAGGVGSMKFGKTPDPVVTP